MEDDEDDEDYNLSDFSESDDDINEDFGMGDDRIDRAIGGKAWGSLEWWRSLKPWGQWWVEECRRVMKGIQGLGSLSLTNALAWKMYS